MAWRNSRTSRVRRASPKWGRHRSFLTPQSDTGHRGSLPPWPEPDTSLPALVGHARPGGRSPPEPRPRRHASASSRARGSGGGPIRQVPTPRGWTGLRADHRPTAPSSEWRGRVWRAGGVRTSPGDCGRAAGSSNAARRSRGSLPCGREVLDQPPVLGARRCRVARPVDRCGRFLGKPCSAATRSATKTLRSDW